MRRVALMWAAWSATILIVASAAMRLPVANSSPWTAVVHAPPLARWDAVWYHSIAADGYHGAGGGRDANVGWYPLYPLLLRWTAALLRAPILWTGIAISIAALLPALILAADLFAQWGGPGAAVPGIAALLLFPTSFYFASVYSESLFLLTTVAAIWAARRRKWALAAAAGFAAALTRLPGVLLALPLTAYAARSPREDGRIGAVAAAVAPLAGAAVFPVYLWSRWGDPLLYLHDRLVGSSVSPKPVWALAVAIAREARARLGAGGRIDDPSFVFQIAAAILFSGLTVALLRRRLVPEGLYVGATLLLLLDSGTLAGFDRYALVLFPGFFVLSEFLRHRPALAFGYVVASTGLGISFLHRFVHWFMVS